MKDISIKDYHEMEGVSSSILKKILVSDAHYRHVIENGWRKNDATTLGDAIHAYFLEPERFSDMYVEETDVYKRATGDFKAGDPKLDEYGDPIRKLAHKSDSSMDVKGEQYKKFLAMVRSVNECDEAMEIINNKVNVEKSFFTEIDGIKVKVRDDMMYYDAAGRLWIVDLKTVGGAKEQPSSVNNFSNTMFDMGYDLQSYMYTEVIKRELPVYGFKFICIDAKVPSGVKIYDIIPGESDWYELGGYRFRYAFNRYKELKAGAKVLTYKDAQEDLPLSYKAADALTQFRGE